MLEKVKTKGRKSRVMKDDKLDSMRKADIKREKEIKKKQDKKVERVKATKSFYEVLNSVLMNVLSVFSVLVIACASILCLRNLFSANSGLWLETLTGCVLIFLMIYFNERLSA